MRKKPHKIITVRFDSDVWAKVEAFRKRRGLKTFTGTLESLALYGLSFNPKLKDLERVRGDGAEVDQEEDDNATD